MWVVYTWVRYIMLPFIYWISFGMTVLARNIQAFVERPLSWETKRLRQNTTFLDSKISFIIEHV